MHRSAGHVASKTERAQFIRGERQRRGLPWVGFDREIIAIDIQAMHHVHADELDRDRVTRVYLKLGGGIRKLPRFDPERLLLRRDDRNWQWSERHDQPGHCYEE